MSSSELIPVLCTRTFSEAQLTRLRAISPRLVVEQRSVGRRADLGAALSPEVEVLFSSFAPESLAPLPRLRWFQSRGAGVNAFMSSPLWTAGVALTTTSGLHAVPIGEYVLGMMIALARDFAGYLEFQKRSCWPIKPKVHFEQFPGRDLRGATVLIVGYGSIGREVARLCSALGMRVLAVKRDPAARVDDGFVVPGTGDPKGELPEKIVDPTRLGDVLPEAGFVVLAAPFTPATRHLLGERELRLMRADAILINIARGELVDEPALVRALEEKWIAAAGLDVFATEPLPPESPLWRLDNAILSPHIAGFSPRYDDYVTDIFAENLRRYVSGEPLLNLVDRRRGY